MDTCDWAVDDQLTLGQLGDEIDKYIEQQHIKPGQETITQAVYIGERLKKIKQLFDHYERRAGTWN